MKNFRLFFILISPFWLISCGQQFFQPFPQAAQGQIDLASWDFEKEPSLELNGEWEFYWEQLLTPNDFKKEKMPDGKSWFIVPNAWTEYSINGSALSSQGYATFRLNLKNVPSLRLALKLRKIQMAHNLWVNGQLISSSGQVGTTEETMVHRYSAEAVSIPMISNELELIIQVSNFKNHHGGISSSISVGPAHAIHTKREVALFMENFLFGSLMIMGWYHLVLAFRYRKDKSALYFGLLCLSMACWNLIDGEYVANVLFPNMPWSIMDKVSYIASFVSLYMLYQFIWLLYPQDFSSKLSPVLLWITVGMSSLYLLFPQHSVRLFFIIWENLALLLISYLLFGLIKSLLHKREGVVFLFFGILFLLGTAVNDVLIDLQWIHTEPMISLGVFVLFVFQSFLVASRFSKAFSLVEAQNAELTMKEDELKIKNNELSKLDQLKNEFLATTSHELRTPLNGIIGMSEALIEGAVDNPEKDLSLIAYSARRLTSLVDGIQDFSQLKHYGVTLQQTPIALQDILDLVFNFIQPLLKGKPIQLVKEIPAELPLVLADEERLQQIFFNLLGNAAKFTSAGVIRVSAEPTTHNRITIRVSDTGMGIEPEAIDHIFDPFERAESARTTQDGIGLGLSITKQLVELHGGSIHVASTVSQGTEFEFTLQQAKGGKPSLSSASSPHVTEVVDEPREIENQPSVASANYRILVVDDDAVNLQVVAKILTPQGYAISTAVNGLDALEILEDDNTFDLVLMDVLMPQLNGIETCRKLRETLSREELPVILLTAKNQIPDIVQGLQAGANDYLTKPFVREELLARIEALIQVKVSVNRLQEILRLQQEIQHHQQTKGELKRSHQRINQILNLSQDVVCAFNAEGMIQFINFQAQEIFNYSEQEIANQSITQLFPDFQIESMKPRLQPWKQSETWTAELVKSQSLRMTPKDGNSCQVTADIFCWQTSDEQGWVVIFSQHNDSLWSRNPRLDNLFQSTDDQHSYERRLQQMEVAFENLEQEYNDLKNSLPSLSTIPQKTPTELRQALVELANLSVHYWEASTQKSKVELAEACGYWNVFLEKRGVFRARTLDRHLHLKTLPKNPRWKEIFETAQYVLEHCPEIADPKKELEQQLAYLKGFSAQIGLNPQPLGERHNRASL